MTGVNEILTAIRKKPRIPAPSQAVTRIMAMTRDPNCDIARVAEAIHRDAAITSQLLREANSAMFASAKKTSSVRDACMRLGLKRVRAAVMNQHVVGGMRDACPPGFDPNRYWQGALATSVAAGDLGQRLLPSRAEDASTAGLLCDIGVSLMAFAIPQSYAGVLAEYAAGDTLAIDEIERRLLGVSHADIGAEILNDWQLEEHLIVAVGRHHRVPDDPCPEEETARFARIVAAAALCSRLALAGSDMENVDRLFRQLDGLTPNPDTLVGEVLEELVVHIKETADSLAVELGETDDLAANLADAVGAIPDCGAAISTRPMESPVVRR